MKRVSAVAGLVVALLPAGAIQALTPLQAATAAACTPTLKAIALANVTVPGGAPDKLTITLTCQAHARLPVKLTAFTGARVPSVAYVPKGQASAPVTVRTTVTKAARHGQIRATLRGRLRTTALTISKTPRTCAAPRLAGFSVPSLTYVGNRPIATVRLTCPSAGPVRVALKSTNSNLPLPAVVTIGGYYTSAAISLVPRAYEPGQYGATLTARYRTASLSHRITVDPGLASVSVPPASEPNLVDVNVLFTGDLPTGGMTVQLASSNPAVTVPPTAAFQTGSIGGGVAGVTVQPVTHNTTVTLSVTLAGRTLRTSTVLLPPWDQSDSLTLTAENGPGDIYGGEFNLEYSVQLSNPAPASGLTATFAATDPSIELQSTSWDISPGTIDAFVDIDTVNVTSPVHATLSATVDGVTASVPVTIEPGLASVTVPATVTGGDSFPVTVNLAGPVDAATTVGLQSSWGIVTVPTLATIPAGESSVTVTASSVPVQTDSDVFIDGMLGTTLLESGTVTLTPPPS